MWIVLPFILLLSGIIFSFGHKKAALEQANIFLEREFNLECSDNSFLANGDNQFYELVNLKPRIVSQRVSKSEKDHIKWKGIIHLKYDLFRKFECHMDECSFTEWKKTATDHLFTYTIRLQNDSKWIIYPLVKANTSRPSCEVISELMSR